MPEDPDRAGPIEGRFDRHPRHGREPELAGDARGNVLPLLRSLAVRARIALEGRLREQNREDDAEHAHSGSPTLPPYSLVVEYRSIYSIIWHYPPPSRAGLSDAGNALLGGIGERVTTGRQLQSALARATRERGRFYLIEIMLGRGALSAPLARLVEAIAEKCAAAQISG
jgi:hypothetical protein